mgnify:CR=1 FL=1
MDKKSKYIWFVVILLMPVALLNYLDRQMLAAMKFSVMSDITDIGSDANWGRMLGQFKWVYAIFSPIGGYIADRFSKRFTICASLFVWSAVTFATGHIKSYEGLLWVRSLMGISEAFYIPAALALISDYHTGETRSRAVGMHQMAIYLGVIIGGFSGYVADSSIGWRGAFSICGIVGIVYAIPLIFSIKDAPKNNNFLDRTAKPSVFNSLRSLLTNGSFILLVLYFTLPAIAGWVVRDWMPAILKERYNIGQGKAGVSATIYWQCAAIVGVIIGGWIADKWMHRNIRGRIYVSAIGMSLIIPAMFGVGNANTLAIAIVFLIVFGLGWGFFDCNNMPILCQIVKPDLRATGYGIMNFVSISCGGAADWVFGLLRDHNVPLNVTFGVFATTAIISVVLVLLIRPKPELVYGKGEELTKT